jgi:hypothetical protein
LLDSHCQILDDFEYKQKCAKPKGGERKEKGRKYNKKEVEK